MRSCVYVVPLLVCLVGAACGGDTDDNLFKQAVVTPVKKSVKMPCVLPDIPDGLDLDELYELGQYHLSIVNADRAFFQVESDGAEPLTWSDALWSVAMCHAIDMCNREFFAHTNPSGLSSLDRIEQGLDVDLGQDFWATGENLAAYRPIDVDATSDTAALNNVVMVQHDLYMDECQCRAGCACQGSSCGAVAGHRTNVLFPDFTEVGIGQWYCAKNGRFFNVQNFWRNVNRPPHTNDYCSGGFTANPPVPWTTAQPW
jgi:hypothetical protein